MMNTIYSQNFFMAILTTELQPGKPSLTGEMRIWTLELVPRICSVYVNILIDNRRVLRGEAPRSEFLMVCCVSGG